MKGGRTSHAQTWVIAVSQTGVGSNILLSARYEVGLSRNLGALNLQHFSLIAAIRGSNTGQFSEG